MDTQLIKEMLNSLANDVYDVVSQFGDGFDEAASMAMDQINETNNNIREILSHDERKRS